MSQDKSDTIKKIIENAYAEGWVESRINSSEPTYERCFEISNAKEFCDISVPLILNETFMLPPGIILQ